MHGAAVPGDAVASSSGEPLPGYLTGFAVADIRMSWRAFGIENKL
jgi:hypothetical protein